MNSFFVMNVLQSIRFSSCVKNLINVYIKLMYTLIPRSSHNLELMYPKKQKVVSHSCPSGTFQISTNQKQSGRFLSKIYIYL